VWSAPYTLDPSRHAAKVTRDVAETIALLARDLEAAGHPSEAVARFLMRCIFTMFAEDIGLIPERIFTDAIETHWLPKPERFPDGVLRLWRAMDTGGDFGFDAQLLKINGGLFRTPEALPLRTVHLEALLDASKHAWSDVEPTIFGTLVERALDPRERHRLGAHYTPRAYVERLVRPTVEEPLRAQWDIVRAEVRQLVGEDLAAAPGKTRKKLDEARKKVREFHGALCKVRVLDPACGSGNFLYVTLDILKRLESEVLALLEALGEKNLLLDVASVTVTPAQFHGIEKKRWAKEIAELVLWIGHLQWHARTRRNADGGVAWRVPVLEDLHNIECRDAVLAWDREEPVLDAHGQPLTRWDGVTRRRDALTGRDLPDPDARVAVTRILGATKAAWPEADFIVGNPPFLGHGHMRGELGDGYTEALRKAHPEVPESCDLVMYWWSHAADLLRAKGSPLRRFGFITTNSISQTFNRRVLERALSSEDSLALTFAIPDHPWVDSADGAAVRIAMTVGVAGASRGTLLGVVNEREAADGTTQVSLTPRSGHILPDLRIGAAVASVQPLRANGALASMGPMFGSRGFVLTRQARDALLAADGPEAAHVIRPFYGGRDLTDRAREQYVIDLQGRDGEQVRARFPTIYQHLLDAVYPGRAQNSDPKLREAWWLFRRSNETYRAMLLGLSRFFVTTETSKHRTFTQASAEFIAEHGTVSFGTDDIFILGVLSSRIHVTWALAAGGRLGIGNDPRYNKTRCFDPFPFPDAAVAQRQRIRDLAQQLDAHRKARQAAHPTLSITGMYNVLVKLRAGDAFTEKERAVYDQGLVSVLRQLHDDLDDAVFTAYGWEPTLTDEEILAKVVALNAARAEEERKGLVRWLRPEFQNPKGTRAATQTDMDLGDADGAAATAPIAIVWPKKPAEQFVAVREWLRGRADAVPEASVADAFKGADGDAVRETIDGLASLGLAVRFSAESGSWVRAA
jgi:hypothetical protein